MREIDGGFACYVVFSGDAVEVKVQLQLGHRRSIRVVRRVLAIRPTVSVVHRARYVFSKPSVEVSGFTGRLDVQPAL